MRFIYFLVLLLANLFPIYLARNGEMQAVDLFLAYVFEVPIVLLFCIYKATYIEKIKGFFTSLAFFVMTSMFCFALVKGIHYMAQFTGEISSDMDTSSLLLMKAGILKSLIGFALAHLAEIIFNFHGKKFHFNTSLLHLLIPNIIRLGAVALSLSISGSIMANKDNNDPMILIYALVGIKTVVEIVLFFAFSVRKSKKARGKLKLISVNEKKREN